VTLAPSRASVASAVWLVGRLGDSGMMPAMARPDSPNAERLVTGSRALQRAGRALQSSSLLYAALVGLAIALAMFGQEKYAVCGGFGDDGCRSYGPWTRDFVRYIADRSIDATRISRILPSGLLYVVLRGIGIRASNANIIRAFELGDVVMVALAAWAWHRMWRRWALRPQTLALGTAALFGTFAVAKWLCFDPVLTDAWAFACGMLGACFYVERRFWLVALVTVVGSFCWPTFLYLGASLLFFFPDAGQAEEDCSSGVWRLLRWACELAAVAAGVGWTWYALHLVPGYAPPNGYEPAWGETLRLSAPLAGVCLFLLVRELLTPQLLRVLLRRPLAWQRPVAIAIALAIHVGAQRLARPAPPTVGFVQGFDMLVFTSVSKPGAFLVAHAAFYGPLGLLAVIGWPRVAGTLRHAGPAVAVAFLSAAPLVLDSESRHLFAHFALLAPFVLLWVDGLGWSWRTVLALSTLAVGSSRIWLSYAEKAVDRSSLRSLLGVIGPWMSTTAYLGCGLCALGAAAWLWRLCRRPRGERPCAAPRAPGHGRSWARRGRAALRGLRSRRGGRVGRLSTR
jgi:hypothetical protein